jgi:hypothetical protein
MLKITYVKKERVPSLEHRKSPQLVLQIGYTLCDKLSSFVGIFPLLQVLPAKKKYDYSQEEQAPSYSYKVP